MNLVELLYHGLENLRCFGRRFDMQQLSWMQKCKEIFFQITR